MTDLTPARRAELRAIAEAATPGPRAVGPLHRESEGKTWLYFSYQNGVFIDESEIAVVSSDEDTPGNAAHIASFDRETTLALLDAADERDDHDKSFDLRWDADQRAIKAWQEANPGNDMTWPDHADLCVWLLAECDRLKAELRRVAPFLAAHNVAGYRLEEKKTP